MRHPPWMTEQPHSAQNPVAGSSRRGIAQCSKCKAKGSANTWRGHIRWSELPHYWVPADGMRHNDCGGRIEAFDIGDAQ